MNKERDTDKPAMNDHEAKALSRLLSLSTHPPTIEVLKKAIDSMGQIPLPIENKNRLTMLKVFAAFVDVVILRTASPIRQHKVIYRFLKRMMVEELARRHGLTYNLQGIDREQGEGK